MTLRDALDRTLLLLRDEIQEGVEDDVLLAALTGTRVALIADEANLSTHSAQTAFVTAAILMARSGHQIFLLAPDISLVGSQPPLERGNMIEQLLRVGRDLLPGIEFSTAPPAGEIDLAVAIGNSAIGVQARRRIRFNAEPWSGRIALESDRWPWSANWWPTGGLAAAGLSAVEAFKASMSKLRQFFRNPERAETVFAPTDELTVQLAPPDTPYRHDLGNFDCVSGGAIINAALYALARIPGVSGNSRIIEPDFSDLSNLNRYMLLLRSHCERQKAKDLNEIIGAGLNLIAVPERFDEQHLDSILPLAPAVLVGVDDIPTRWEVQRANPLWLGIGATTHWGAMASFHRDGTGCAQCLHREDDLGNARIPTAAFVSFWAGLLLATYFLRDVAGSPAPLHEQQIYLTPFRAENPFKASVARLLNCPTCGGRTGCDSIGAVA